MAGIHNFAEPILAQVAADPIMAGSGMTAGFGRVSRAAEFIAVFDLSHLALRFPV